MVILMFCVKLFVILVEFRNLLCNMDIQLSALSSDLTL
jgi:hypothetical protein